MAIVFGVVSHRIRRFCPGLWEMEPTSVHDTTKRASQRLRPHIQGESPFYHSGNKPLDSTTLFLSIYREPVWVPFELAELLDPSLDPSLFN